MNSKLIVALSCAIGLGTPIAGAHLTNPGGSLTSAFWTGDNCRYAGGYATGNVVFDDYIYPKNKGSFCPNLNNGVSGTYVTGPGGLVGGDGVPFTLAPLVTLAPSGYLAAAVIECDMEVLSYSGGEAGVILFNDPKQDPLDLLLDETDVDGAPTGTVVPDGTWDDGGLGGACHREIFANPNLNTPGCSGTSHAEDGASGANVWIGAGCDFYSGNVGLVACFALAVRGGTNLLQRCVDNTVCQITDPASCTPSFASCGADGQIDAVNYGEGGGSIQFEAGVDENTGPFHSLGWLLDNKKKDADWEFFGVRYPTLDSVNFCPAATGAPVTYAFQGVEANLGDVIVKNLAWASEWLFPGSNVVKYGNGEQSYPNVEHTFVTAGWIDWTNDVLGEGNANGSVTPYDGITIGLCKIPVPDPIVPGGGNLGDLIESISNPNNPSEPLFTCPDDNSLGALNRQGPESPTLAACMDLKDNDGDGLLDGLDPGCSSPSDSSERGSLACDDGIDNDGDGSADYPQDHGCDTVFDTSETPTSVFSPCNDLIDNDGDTRVDYPNDPGCSSIMDTSEYGSTQCDDGYDNDGDRAFDYPTDPDCRHPADNDESSPPPPPPPRPVGHT